MAKVRSARRLAESKSHPVAGGEVVEMAEPPVGYLFGGLLLGFLGGGLSMRAWDARSIGEELTGRQWDAEVSWAIRVTMGLPAWVWTLVLFGCAAVVSFAWMAEARRQRMVAVVGASVVSVATMVVLATGLYQPVKFGPPLAEPGVEVTDAAEVVE